LSELNVKANLMSTLVQANMTQQKEAIRSGDKRGFLQDEELYGNLFVFNLAGFDTTANAMFFTLPLLAANPKVQEWVSKEVKEVLLDNDVCYDDAFSRLRRTLALLVRYFLFTLITFLQPGYRAVIEALDISN